MTATILPFHHPAPVAGKAGDTALLALLDVSCLDTFICSALARIQEEDSAGGASVDEGLFIGMAAVHGYQLKSIDRGQALIMIDGHRYRVRCEALDTPTFAAAVWGALEAEIEANTARVRLSQARRRLQSTSIDLHCSTNARINVETANTTEDESICEARNTR